MLARLTAFVVWALVAATAVFWGLRLWVHAPTAPSYAVAVVESGVARGDLTRLLGAAPASAPDAAPAPQTSSRFRLLGIVAPKFPDATSTRSAGLALIAVDGKIPKAYAVGAPIDGELVLQSVSLRTASIGAAAGAPAITLELPSTASAATGALPPAATNGEYVVPPPVTVPRYVPPPLPVQRAPATVAPRLPMPPASRVPLQGLAQ